MTGPCALCGTHAPLLNSHFMPRSLYQELVEPNFAIKQMIVLKCDKTNQSSLQFSMHLLCQGCEIRFQHGGEDWTLGNRYRTDGSFPIRDLLLNASPVETKPDGSRVYEARTVAGLAVDQLVYFEAFNSILEARAREHSLKRWHRTWKIALIEKLNPGWRDLSSQLNS